MAVTQNELITALQTLLSTTDVRLLMRTGKAAQLDLSSLVAGEFAVATDTQEVYCCFGNGIFRNLARGIVVKGVYATLSALQASHSTGTEGDIYAAGSAPQHLYVWTNSSWVDMGAWNDMSLYASNDSFASGWVPVTEALTYASANTITVASGAHTRFQKGDKIKFTQNGVQKYGYIIVVADTVLTFTAGSQWVVENTDTYPITSVFISRAENPEGFPSYFPFSIASWATTATSFTNPPDVIGTKFVIRGGQVKLWMESHSNVNSGGTGVFIATLTPNQLPYESGYAPGTCAVESTLVGGYSTFKTGKIMCAKFDGTAIVGNDRFFSIALDYFY